MRAAPSASFLILALLTASCGSSDETNPDAATGEGAGGSAGEQTSTATTPASGGDGGADDGGGASPGSGGAGGDPLQAAGGGGGVGEGGSDVGPDLCLEWGGDTDDDGICDAFDNCVAVDNESQDDADGDELGDACDPVDGANVCAGSGGDEDDDDVCQALDNCDDVANDDQIDQDHDGTGDACDATPLLCDDLGGDADGDTVCDDVDNCPVDANLGQVDLDSDGVGDVCDPVVPGEPQYPPCAGQGGDDDNDGWCASIDDCPTTSNPTQADVDGDGVGDACDVEVCDGRDNDGDGQIDEGFADSDDDGAGDCSDPCPFDPADDVDGDDICGDVDNCPELAGSSQADRDGDGIGNACDVEECDGVSNDVDSQIDEGMPDADADGLCDGIDPCPLDWSDDVDADDVCGDVDVCPALSDPDQLDSDDDGRGDACDRDSAIACGAAATILSPTQVVPSPIAFGGVVAHPTSNLVFASVRSSSSNLPNRLLAIDPSSGTPRLVWSLLVGSDPGPLAISADGSLLYVGLQGARTVRMVEVATRRPCLEFGLGALEGPYPVHAADLGVLPGDPEAVVISTRRTAVSPDFGGVAVYDNGVRRREITGDHTGAREIAVAGDDTVYGYNNGTTEYGFRRLSVDLDGIREEWNERALFTGFSVDIIHEGGLVFTTSGVVVQPSAPSLLATLSGASGPVAADVELREVYFASSSSTIDVYDLDSLTFEREVAIAGASGTPLRLVRWGANGLALLTASGLAVVTNAAGP